MPAALPDVRLRSIQLHGGRHALAGCHNPRIKCGHLLTSRLSKCPFNSDTEVMRMGEMPTHSLAMLLRTSAAIGAGLLCFSSTSIAQQAPAEPQVRHGSAEGPIESVTVSATRITSTSFDAPTPMTAVSALEIEAAAQSNVFSALTELPSLMGSTGVQVGRGTGAAAGGLSEFSIHGLGSIRTLTLMNGQRVVPAYVTGTVDVSQFPQLLISRTDVVTGGASASYGSDAVAGVVNFIIDNKFQGLKANVLTGISTYGDNENATVQLAGGNSFAGGRGHFVLSGEYSYEAGVGAGGYGVGCAAGQNGRCWWNSPAILRRTIAGTPPGEPQYTFATNVQDYQFTRGGLITRGPLQGTAFAPDGTPYQFEYGSDGVPSRDATGSVANCVSPFCIGGDTTHTIGNGLSLASQLERKTIYAHLSYEVVPGTTLWLGFNGSEVQTKNAAARSLYRPDYFTIQCGNAPGGPNAYLPDSINVACVDNNITNFRLGSTLSMLPNPVTPENTRDMMRYTAGIDGSFVALGKGWNWSTYFQHGVNKNLGLVRNIILVPHLVAAADAVAGPNGTVVCRSPAAQAAGCVPINIFGDGSVESGAIAFLQGGEVSQQTIPYQRARYQQDVVSLSVNSEPFSTWAGPVLLAFGAEYREEESTVSGDPASDGGTDLSPLLNPAGNNWFAGNFRSGGGKYDVIEGFLEAGVPLVNNSAWGKIDLNLAGRATDYSTSGYVPTWKLGVTWDTPVDGLRFRALRSQDVRAPNLSELYPAPVVTNNNVVNPFLTPPTAVSVQFERSGNPQLVPEEARNNSIGLVYQPDWLPGFRFSADYYRIKMSGAIQNLTAQQSIDLCYQGFNAQCSAIITTDGGPPETSPFQRILLQPYNMASLLTDGFDFDASYGFSVGNDSGDILLRLRATHVRRFIEDSGIPGTVPIDSAGSNVGDVPDWKILASQTYTRDKWSVTLSEKWISSGTFANNYIERRPGSCPLPTIENPTINYNYVPSALYLRLSGGYRFNDRMEAYFKVDNLTNVTPPAAPSSGSGTTPNNNGLNPGLYDLVGRMYGLGLRFTM